MRQFFEPAPVAPMKNPLAAAQLPVVSLPRRFATRRRGNPDTSAGLLIDDEVALNSRNLIEHVESWRVDVFSDPPAPPTQLQRCDDRDRNSSLLRTATPRPERRDVRPGGALCGEDPGYSVADDSNERRADCGPMQRSDRVPHCSGARSTTFDSAGQRRGCLFATYLPGVCEDLRFPLRWSGWPRLWERRVK